MPPPWPESTAVPYDGIFAAAIVDELQRKVVGARIDKIFQPTRDTLLLHCRKPGETYKLLISVHPRHPRVHLTSGRPDNPLHAPVFCMTLRKHLDPGRIAGVEQRGLDRIVHIYIDGFDDVGRPARRVLIAELTGRNSNVVLVDEASGRIIDALKRVNARVNLYRALLPGEAYIPPPSGEKVDGRDMAVAEICARIEDGLGSEEDDEKKDRPIAPVLTRRFDGMSPFAAREVVLRAGSGDTVAVDQVAQSLHALVRDVVEGRFSITLKRDASGDPADLWAFRPLQWEDDAFETFAGANEAADVFFTHETTSQIVADKRRLLERGINTARKRLVRKAKALEKDLKNADRADEFRIYGELLTANMHLVGRGDEATVPNYYEDGDMITIPLDPTLGPAANAQRYFKRYAKLKTALTVVQQQLNETEADINWLDQATVHVQMASTPEQLDEIARELLSSGMMPRNVRASLRNETPSRRSRGRRSGSRRPGAHQPPAPPTEAVISDGIRILIGGNGRQNDRISLRLAKPDDLWLHVKDMPGAHVLLPRNQDGLAGREDIPLSIIEEAAGFAAYFSQARHSANVAVDWTRAKHVRKPRGARPGMVIYDGHRTVYVTPDQNAIQVGLDRAKSMSKK